MNAAAPIRGRAAPPPACPAALPGRLPFGRALAPCVSLRHAASAAPRTPHRRGAAPPRAAAAPLAAAGLAAAVAAAPSLDALADLLEAASLEDMMAAAAALRDSRHAAITFSPKVFIPLTRLCRDACGYCTFAQPPAAGRRAFMTLEEVLAVAKAGAALSCTEALFTLGDKPELRWPEAAAELAAMGYATTLEYVAAAARMVLEETGMLPHINAGVMGEAELRALREVSVSQGLMLESLSQALLAPGAAHAGCPDKAPAARLAALEAAGAARVPFTSGILIGIGESRRDRLEALRAVAAAHARHGHVQEVIVQNFRAKMSTAMAAWPEPPLEELLWSVAAARLVLGAGVSVQAPPNLSPEADDAAPALSAGADGRAAAWQRLIDAGINDWGGVSPVTLDWVNPEARWPHLAALAAATAAAGFPLLPRLPVYPRYLAQPTEAARWLDGAAGAASPLGAALAAADGAGLARGARWAAGAADEAAWPAAPAVDAAPASASAGRRAGGWSVELGEDGLLLLGGGSAAARPAPTPAVARLLAAALAPGSSYEPAQADLELLFAARGADFAAVCAAADALRRRAVGDEVSYVVNRNINYTNVCTYGCRFCAFSKGPAADEALREPAYLLPLEEVERRAAEAWARGATEVCLQGGIHPSFTGETYLEILAAAKRGAPGIHVHAFSPLEVAHGAATLGWPAARFLAALRAAGLGSLPGTAAEVLDDAVRAELCPDKLSAAEWLGIVEAAHGVGLKTTSTIMFGHVDSPVSSAASLSCLSKQKTAN
jgi:FO synthase